jgi:hypothetical protein
MLSVYSVYFNNEADVVVLASCENYSDVEKNFAKYAQHFVNYYYPDSATSNSAAHPVKICKYEEGVNSSAVLASAVVKSDVSFPKGLVFIKKKFEACVYEKTCYPGTVYNSYVVKYLGRIGVIMQEVPGQTEVIQRLKDVADAQESKIRRLEADIKRLEAANAVLEKNAEDARSESTVVSAGVAVTKSSKPKNFPLRPEFEAMAKNLAETGRPFGNTKYKVKRASPKKELSANDELNQIIAELDEITRTF